MEIQNTNNFLKMLKKIKSSNYIYLGIIFVFFLIIFILFLYSTGFIIKNINKMFLEENTKNIQPLDEKSYSLLEKKLNLKNVSQNAILDIKTAQ